MLARAGAMSLLLFAASGLAAGGESALPTYGSWSAEHQGRPFDYIFRHGTDRRLAVVWFQVDRPSAGGGWNANSGEGYREFSGAGRVGFAMTQDGAAIEVAGTQFDLSAPQVIVVRHGGAGFVASARPLTPSDIDVFGLPSHG